MQRDSTVIYTNVCKSCGESKCLVLHCCRKNGSPFSLVNFYAVFYRVDSIVGEEIVGVWEKECILKNTN